MKQWLFIAAVIAALASIVQAHADKEIENCAPKNTGVKILTSPQAAALDPDWANGFVGMGWGLSVNGTATNDGVTYKYGHLISSRGTLQPAKVYVIANEWTCSGTSSQNDNVSDKLAYRRFIVDISAVKNAPNFAAIEDSLKHQIDIVADCGAKPEILEFFRGRRITLKQTAGDEPGVFVANQGIYSDAAPQRPEQPVLLHELLHAYQFLVLPGGFQNPDIERFYDNAIRGERYPAINKGDRYVLKILRNFLQ